MWWCQVVGNTSERTRTSSKFRKDPAVVHVVLVTVNSNPLKKSVAIAKLVDPCGTGDSQNAVNLYVLCFEVS
jgi:hypothetical protein